MKIIIAGCTGRMGKALLLRALKEAEAGHCTLVGATVNPNSPAIGKDLHTIAGNVGRCGIKACSDLTHLLANAEAVINFTTPAYSCLISKICNKNGLVHICGTTGFNEKELDIIHQSALKSPLLFSANMSIGITILAEMVRQAASKLHPAIYDADIIEMHHKNKIDSPSGTALMLGEKIAQGRHIPLQTYLVNKEKRPNGTVWFSSVRTGGMIGTHNILFTSEHEIISIQHQSFNRDIYVDGAFKACYWMKNKPAGKVYTMLDILEQE